MVEETKFGSPRGFLKLDMWVFSFKPNRTESNQYTDFCELFEFPSQPLVLICNFLLELPKGTLNM